MRKRSRNAIASDGSSTRRRQKTTTIAKRPATSYSKTRARSRTLWRSWLQAHHSSSPGVWLIFAKKHSRLATVSYDEAVEEALCFGWVDSLMNPIDDRFYMQLFTPRKAKSAWSPSNKARVERLRAGGLMTEAGEAAIGRAKDTGTWDAYSGIDSLTAPTALRKALNANPAASTNWPTFTDKQRLQYLSWLLSAKREPTRAMRMSAIVELVARRITPSQAQERKLLRPSASRAPAPSPVRRRRG